MRRNLLFHLYPVRGSIWPWHVDRLLSHLGVWNGRRVVVVVTDGLTDRENEVRSRLAPLEADILVRPNVPPLGEAAYFTEGLSLLESRSDGEATFYAHAKGVTRQSKWVASVQSWSEAMYVLNLSRMEAVERRLSSFASVGCFRQIMNHCESPWHYSGTFFWLKHSVIFSRNWRDIVAQRHGVEGYPGRHINLDESSSLTPDNIFPQDLYRIGVEPRLMEEIDAWLAKEEAR